MRAGFLFRALVTAFMAMTVIPPGGLWLYGVPAPIFAKNLPLPPPIATVRGMSDLATTKGHTSFPLEGSNKHYIGKWSVHGEILYGVGLSQAVYSKVDPEKKEVVLSLPNPHMISCKIDHEQSEELYVKAIAWFPTSDKQLLRNQCWVEAQRKLERSAQDTSYAEHAKTQAERVLVNLFVGAGWKVTCQWPDTPPALVATP